MENQKSKKEKKLRKKKELQLFQDEEQLRINQAWADYRISVSENKSKSQDDFEKYINLMASGALALTLTFLEKIVVIDQAIFKGFIVTGWFLLPITLLSNLYSHYKSIIDSDETLKDIDENKFDDIFKNIEKRNLTINWLNRISIWSLILGVLCIITFVTINFYNMSDKAKPSPNQQSNPSREEQLGRSIPPPPRNTPNNPKK